MTLPLVFIPLFVAVDPFGVLPVYASLTSGLPAEGRRALLRESILTAFVVAAGFLALGRLVFQVLGITTADFQVAGGLLLLVFAVDDLLFARSDRKPVVEAGLGVVPLAVPLIVGPAVLTTLLVLSESFGLGWTLAGLVLNLALLWAVLARVDLIVRTVGVAGSRAVGKIASLFLAAIAVSMIRAGLGTILRG
jgi:multiple antibiotic resistance protein